MSTECPIVVTGSGVVTPIGIGVDEYWNSLLAGRSGVRIRDELRDCPWPMKLYAPVTDFDGKQWVRPRKGLKVMCRPIQFGYAAAVMALKQAGLDDSPGDPDRLGTVFGSETFFADPMEVASVFRKCVKAKNYIHDRWGEFAMREIQPLWMLKYLPNMVTSHISIAADARGPSNSICQGEASGLLALIEGANLIERGACDVVIVGGTGSQTSLSGMLYRGQHDVSNRFSDPERACRPFDADRDGLVYGEGAGALILEKESHARARGARSLGKICGWSRSFANPGLANSNSVSFANSIASSLQTVLERSNIDVANLSHVNSHASGHVQADSCEAIAIEKIFGSVPVVAVKSNFGYLGPGSSTIELIASLVSLNEGVIPPTLNYEKIDANCPVNVNSMVTPSDGTTAIKISFSATGQIACVGIRNNTR